MYFDLFLITFYLIFIIIFIIFYFYDFNEYNLLVYADLVSPYNFFIKDSILDLNTYKIIYFSNNFKITDNVTMKLNPDNNLFTINIDGIPYTFDYYKDFNILSPILYLSQKI